MAHKRMFSKDITSSDAFLDMPSSSQALYFHLGMEADDDGFIGNPKKVMRVIGVGDDDFKILLAKRFVIDFPSGVVVVKHHRINNNWDKYNCKRTMYLEEFSKLNIKENRAYTLDKLQGIPVQSDYSLKAVSRIEENRRDKNTSVANAPRVVEVSDSSEEERPKVERRTKDKLAIYTLFSSKEQPWWRHAQQKKAALSLFDLVGVEKVRRGLEIMKEHEDDKYCPQAATPFEYEEQLPKLTRYVKRNSL